MIDLLVRLLDAKLDVGFSQPLYWREIIGNAFGLASALLGMRRQVWAWPIGIIGNIVLFTVFVAGVVHLPDQRVAMWGQAGRQVFFCITSVYGWVVWGRYRRSHPDQDGVSVQPRWATARERSFLIGVALIGWVVFYFALKALGSWGPWSDAWILTGSILATFAMARGWTEFWLIWLAVDAVGVPLLLTAGYYPSAIMYLVYAAFVVWGFITWVQIQRRETAITGSLVQHDTATKNAGDSGATAAHG